MNRVHTRSTRARMALAACVLWLVGVEVMPALHEAMHGQLAPHRHDRRPSSLAVARSALPVTRDPLAAAARGPPAAA